MDNTDLKILRGTAEQGILTMVSDRTGKMHKVGSPEATILLAENCMYLRERIEQAKAPSLALLQARALELLGAVIDLQLKNVTYSDPDAERAARLAIDLARAVGAV
jgi:hypothetical protein